MSVDRNQALEVALSAAHSAGEILSDAFHEHQQVTMKSDGDIVTKTDLAADRAITDRLTDVYPSHAIDSEESAAEVPGTEYVWRVDPLDGTENFSRGLPMFTTSIALMQDGEPIVGVVHNPLTKTTYSAIAGEGAHCDGEPLAVSNCTNPDEALATIMAAGHYSTPQRAAVSDLFEEGIHQLWSLRLIVSQALELAAISAGRAEGTVCLKSRGYSAAAGILLVREAGGQVTDVEGNEYGSDSTSLVASNGEIHNNFLSLADEVSMTSTNNE